MAHNLSIVNGIAEMAYAGEKPWHELGTQVQGLMTAQEALQAAHLDWDVERRQLYMASGQLAKTCFATVRTDTGDVLGAVGPGYTPLQNREAFALLDSIVAENLAMYETCGALQQGARVWLLAKLPESVAVLDRDPMEQYLLLANGHDGTLAVNVMWTPIRVVCNNTLSAALGSKQGRRYSTMHTLNIHNRVAEAQKVLGLSKEYFQEFVKQAEVLATHKYTHDEVNQFFGSLFQLDPMRVGELIRAGGQFSAVSDADDAKEKAVVNIFKLAEVGKGNQEWASTSWGLYNGLTEWIDYHRHTRRDHPAERRFEGSWFGNQARLRQQGWTILAGQAGQAGAV